MKNSLSETRNYKLIVDRILKILPPEAEIKNILHLETPNKTYPIHHINIGLSGPKKILISAGIHGDEPGGIETIIQFIERKLYNPFLSNWTFNIIPCINPFGYEFNKRENFENFDLNRCFKKSNPPKEVKFVQKIVSDSLNLDIELHEDVDSPGYYLYQKPNEPRLLPLGKEIINNVKQIMPINNDSSIDESDALKGIITPKVEPENMEWWPMAIFSHMQNCAGVFTLESSTHFSMEKRVEAQLMAIETALKYFEKFD